ncbi:alpha/beta fold hydrolase [Synechocystis salina LEGE 06099]|uniref:alpha/beta fold hydrolase n=1 Tax=Synechocystis salina TaxID=945780 RepID=UPI00188306EC|nr:alpha/beta fold hydrolase [Synechocystis salina]MBE9202831.1 alpha/beta fold hydrolase [Synechocystis salina LEGE 06099]
MQSFSPQITAPTGNYWQWQGHKVHYVQAGQPQADRPSLLLVHGFGASTDHWRKNIEELQAQFQVWAIDLLGFGRSDKPAQEYSGQLWEQQLLDFIDQVIGEKTVVAGNSLGGYASLCAAANGGDKIAGVVLLNSAGPFGDQISERSINLAQKMIQSLMLQPLPSYLLFQYLRRKPTIRKTLKKVYVDQTAVTDRLVEEIYRPSCDVGAAQVFASVFKSPQGEMVDKLLAKLQAPLLVIWGEGDPWMRVKERSVKFRQHYPQLTEHFLPAGHCPHDEDPSTVNRLMRDWLATIG